ncbi:MAG TPA: tRNA lysidine(34) synthetase TilS [Dehalococcoidia bacterium]|nr:tRNA lysidine(34) synthetase TilS [Dehalococcoidia bacterium]
MASRAKGLVGRVLDFIRRHDLVPSGQRLLVAVSGGPDSVCLLHILWQLRQELGAELYMAHLNHQLRGAESEADAAYVEGLAHRLGLPLIVERGDVRGYQARHRCSEEEAAREVRYAFLARSAEALGAGAVALGHTADDQAETILMHLVRGTGAAGFRGMSPLVRRRPQGATGPLVLVRPLLEVSREETQAYCQDHDLKPRWDASNVSPAHLRNRFRSELLPLLEGLNPNIKEVLLRAARSLDLDLDYLEGQAAALWGQVASREDQTLALDTAKMRALHPSLQRHLLRRALRELLGDLKDVEAVHIEDLASLVGKPAGRRLSLLRGLEAATDYGRLLLGFSIWDRSTLEGEYRLEVPGEVKLPGGLIRASLLREWPETYNEAKGRVFGDYRASGGGLTVRARRPGDRFQPLGMDQPKKLQDFMVDAKIPRALRDGIPLVCSPRGILWVVGYRLAHWARVTEETEQVLCLEYFSDPGRRASQGG